MLSKEELLEKIGELLKQLGISLVDLAKDPRRLDQATDYAWKAAPFWLRPIGKERLRGVILQLSERIPRRTPTEPEQSGAAPEIRLRSIQAAVQEMFGDVFATRKSLRG